MNPNCSSFSAKQTSPATLRMAMPVDASTQEVRIRILSTSAARANSRARVSWFDDSSEEILGGARAGARLETEPSVASNKASQEECVARVAD